MECTYWFPSFCFYFFVCNSIPFSYSLKVLTPSSVYTVCYQVKSEDDNNIYVSPVSTCNTTCGQQNCPCLTISQGILAAENTISNTTITIYCMPGTYSGQGNTNLNFRGYNFNLMYVNVFEGVIKNENN